MGGSRWRPKRWAVVLFCAVSSCVGLGLLVGFVTGIGPYDLPSQSRQLEETIAVSRSLGLPMTQAELVGEIPPDDQNAAPEVVAIMRELRGKAPDSKLFLTRESFDKSIGAIRAVELENERLDRIAELFVSRPGWVVDRDYDLSVFLLLPECADAKGATRLFHCRSIIRSKRGDLKGAIADIRTGREISLRFGRDPLVIPLLVSIACDNIALRAVEAVAADHVDDPSSLLALEEAVLDGNVRRDPENALRGEFYSALALTRNFKLFGGLEGLSNVEPSIESPPQDFKKLQRSGLPHGMAKRAWLAVIAGVFNEVATNLKDTDPPRRGWGKIFRSRSDAMESRMSAAELLPRIILPVYADTDRALMQHDVSMNLAVALLRCLRFRAEHGSWPGSLAEIGADFPDPLSSGGKIKAKFGPNELRVWSVGRDGVDDGGKIRKAGEKGEDTVFVWPPTLRLQTS